MGVAYKAQARRPNALTRTRKSFVAFRTVIVHYVQQINVIN